MKELVITDAATVNGAPVSFETVMGVVLDVASRDAPEAWTQTMGIDVGPKVSFELVAVSNRVDLYALGHESAGEIRFVYGMLSAGTRLPVSVTVELALPAERTPEQWAAAFHALGNLGESSGADALFALVGEVLASPLRGQVRTQDARATPSVLREFDIDGNGIPVASPLVNEPRTDSADLTAWVLAHQDEVLAGTFLLPRSMLSSWGQTVPRAFSMNGVSSAVQTAFVDGTCSGCHTAEPTLDGDFHVSPLRRGQSALSSFLVTPYGDAANELERRAEVLRKLLCDAQ